MSTLKIWNLHMTYDGPITKEYSAEMKQMAESIAKEPGMIWKIWTFEDGTNRLVSSYLFRNLKYLEAYKEMHTKRLKAYGITLKANYILDIMEDVNAITNAPLDG